VDVQELHRRLVAAGIPDVVGVDLPQATYDRINNMINSVLTTPVPGWIMSLFAAQDGLTAGYYHYRNVERIEHAVDDIARRIYADPPADMLETNMSFAARTLTYEYQAFIFALRRSFDYLAGALTLGFGCPQATSFKDVPKKLKHATTRDSAAAEAISAKVDLVRKAFSEVFGDQKGLSVRDQIAHRRSVPGGQFTVWFRPGRPVAVELNGGGEDLPLLGDHTQAPGRLCAILLDRLVHFEDTFIDLAERIPAIAAARAESPS
jgi:hypothetical protein